jgi:hypothetical protein
VRRQLLNAQPPGDQLGQLGPVDGRPAPHAATSRAIEPSRAFNVPSRQRSPNSRSASPGYAENVSG